MLTSDNAHLPKLSAAGGLYNYNKYTVTTFPSGTYEISSWSSDVYISAGTFYQSYSLDPYTGVFSLSGASVNLQGQSGYVGWYTILDGKLWRVYSNADADDYVLAVFATAVQAMNEGAGSLVSTIQAIDGTYPANGKHTDGYWYIRGSLVNVNPVLTITNASNNQTLSEHFERGDY